MIISNFYHGTNQYHLVHLYDAGTGVIGDNWNEREQRSAVLSLNEERQVRTGMLDRFLWS